MNKQVANIGLVLLWLLLTSAGPFMFILIGWHPHQLLSGAVLSVMTLFLLAKRNCIIEDKIILFILALQVCFFSLAALYHSDFSYTALSIRMIVVATVYVFVTTFIGINKTAESVVNVMAIIGILGIVAFLGAATGLLKPIAEYVKPNNDLLYNYLLTFSNTVFKVGDIQLIRASGYFEEPGAFAYYITHALILNKLLYDSKKIERILVISGIFTLSLAFFITMFLYYSFFYLNKRNYKHIFSIVLVLVPFYIVVTLYKEESPLLNTISTITIDRFSLSGDDGAIIRGDNRSDSFKDGIKYFVEKPLMGHGFKNVNDNFTEYNTASIFGSLVIDGMIGISFLFLQVVYFCLIVFYGKNTSSKIFLAKLAFILLLNYLQRPHVFEVFPYLIIILIISLAKQNYVSGNYNWQKQGTEKPLLV